MHAPAPQPVERVCCCPPYSDGRARPLGNANHLAHCNARHAATFFAAVLMAREDAQRG